MSTLINRPSTYQRIALETQRAISGRHGSTSLVYFIESKEAEAIKVGVTTQLDKRFSTLQMSCPFELTLLGVVPGDSSHESRIHLLFCNEHMRGEWFRSSGNLRTFIDAIMKLPESKRTEFVEREPSVPENICRPEAETEARDDLRRIVEVVAEEHGAWFAAQLYLKAWLR